MARIEISSVSNPYGTGELQLQGKVAMSGTLTAVTDNLNNASPLKLSTGGVQVASTLQITTNSNPYIDAEDGAGNNRFQVGRDPSSQVVNVDFASNPTGGTNMVGGIRTYTDGVNLSQVMSFRKDGLIGVLNTSPQSALDVSGTILGNIVGNKNGNPVIGSDGSNIALGVNFASRIVMVSSRTDIETNGVAVARFSQSGNTLLNTTASDTSRLSIKGSGSTSATTSLLVQNSSATDILKITDDGVTTINGFASVTKIGDNNHSSILSVLNTDSTNTTFGFLFKSYSDGGSNRYIELEGSNTTGNLFLGSWATTGVFATLNGITNAYHSNFSIYQTYSNNVDTGILFSNNNNSYQTRIWRDGNVSIADSSYNTSASVTSRLFVKGSGSTSGTTSLLVQNSVGTSAMTIKDDLSTNLGGILNLVYNSSYISASGGANSSTTFIANTTAGWNGFAFGNSSLSYFAEIRTDRTNVYTPLFVTLVGNSSSAPPPTPNASAILQADSTTQGFLPPRMTDAQVRAIVSPAVGLMAYNTDLDCPVFYSSAGWRKVSHSVM